MGYGIEHKVYRCYDPVSNRLRVSYQVGFWEHQQYISISLLPSQSLSPQIFTDISFELSSTNETLVGTSSSNSDPSSSTPPIPDMNKASNDTSLTFLYILPPLHRSTQVREPNTQIWDLHCYYALATIHEPRNFHKASSNPMWHQAMAEELQALKKTHTWDIIDR